MATSRKGSRLESAQAGGFWRCHREDPPGRRLPRVAVVTAAGASESPDKSLRSMVTIPKNSLTLA